MFLNRRRLLSGILAAGGEAPVEYLFFDDFTTPQSAPLTSPRTAEPGPGTSAIVDTGNNLSISGGTLVSAGSVNTYDPQYQASENIPDTVGTCAIFKVKQPSEGRRFLMYFDKDGGQAIIVSSGNIQVMAAPGVGTFTGTDWHRFYYISWDTYCLVIMDSTFLYLGKFAQTCQPNISAYTNTNSSWLCDYVAAANLPAPWNTIWGIVTDRVASPVDGETITQLADAFVFFEWTCATGEVLNIMVRRTDDDNCWIIRCDQANSTMKLIKKEGGVETESGSQARTWLNTGYYAIGILTYGSTIKVITINFAVVTITETSASFNQTATGVKATGFAAGANLVSFPRTMSGSALSVLQAYAP